MDETSFSPHPQFIEVNWTTLTEFDLKLIKVFSDPKWLMNMMYKSRPFRFASPCECVVDARWITNNFTSATFVIKEKSWMDSINFFVFSGFLLNLLYEERIFWKSTIRLAWQRGMIHRINLEMGFEEIRVLQSILKMKLHSEEKSFQGLKNKKSIKLS